MVAWDESLVRIMEIDGSQDGDERVRKAGRKETRWNFSLSFLLLQSHPHTKPFLHMTVSVPRDLRSLLA